MHVVVLSATHQRVSRRVWATALPAVLLAGLALGQGAQADEGSQYSITTEADRLVISRGQQPLGQYVWKDPHVPRPSFQHLCAPDGTQITRSHPPRPETELTDHPQYHPGLWMAFGDLSGADFWRCQEPVEHRGFFEPPSTGPDWARFAVENRYVAGGRVLADEVCRITLRTESASGTWLIWDSQFTAGPQGCVFGDQEEMGLGIRLTRPLIVREGGTILNAEGRRNEAGVWGRQAKWCAYFGRREGRLVGVLMVPDPMNFRESWFHARDYGLLAANPFGVQAFTRGPASRVEVAAGQVLRLRFALLLFSGDEPDWQARSQQAVDLMKAVDVP